MIILILLLVFDIASSEDTKYEYETSQVTSDSIVRFYKIVFNGGSAVQ